MVREAEEFAEEDKIIKERIDARNGLESYLYNLKNQFEDDERGVSDITIDKFLDWMDVNLETEKEEYKEKQKDSKDIANPIMRRIHDGGDEEMGDFRDDEL